MKCDLCKEKINTKKEKYVHVEDWEKEKMKSELWMHLACFKKGMNRELTAMEKQAQQMLNQAGKLYDRLASVEI